MNTHTSQRSQTGMLAVLIALLLPMLMGFLALSIDVGYMLLTRNRMQIAADSAAIAAADALMHNQGIDAATAMAQTAAVANGFTDQVSMTSVAVLIPPTGAAPFSQDSNYVRVTVSQTVPTFIASFFGIASSLRSAYAIAGPASSGNLSDSWHWAFAHGRPDCFGHCGGAGGRHHRGRHVRAGSWLVEHGYSQRSNHQIRNGLAV